MDGARRKVAAAERGVGEGRRSAPTTRRDEARPRSNAAAHQCDRAQRSWRGDGSRSTLDAVKAWGGVTLVIIAAGLIRLRLLDVPLDRDEGEYAYIARLLLAGAFGETPAGIRLGLTLVTSASTVCVFLLGRRLLGQWSGVAAAATFAALTLSPALLGTAANAEHFAVLPGLIGLLLLLRAAPSGSRGVWLAAGVLFGIALVIKQHAVSFVLCAVIYLALAHARRALVWVLAGALVPVAAVSLWFAAAGAFRELWFWTVTYASAYASIRSPADGLNVLPEILGMIVPFCFVALILAGVGAVLTVGDRDLRPVARFLVPFTLTSLLSTVIGFYFRPQYFLLLTPALALLAAVAVRALSERLRPRLGVAGAAIAAAVLLVAVSHILWAHRAVFFELGPDAVARAIYGGNPFPESVAVGRYLKERTGADDRIVVIGSEPEVYFYARRRAGTRYIYMYPLFENQPYAASMQDELIRDVETVAPRFVVYVNVPTSWLVSPAAPRRMLEWFEGYRQAHLEQVGLVDMLTPQLTLVYWDGDARGKTPRSNLWLAVYRRRDAS
ncbi:MAG: hypothetical protein DMD90_27625 [Candidatus Rokuibacteriota bacterium]|nr:MAG: hypothetical protein DMD90_27625 [Candidatus Rokubacteria bacterium]